MRHQVGLVSGPEEEVPEQMTVFFLNTRNEVEKVGRQVVSIPEQDN